MRNFLVGCFGAILGIALGLALIFAVAFALNPTFNRGLVADVPLATSSDISVSISAAFLQSQIQPVVAQSGIAQQATVTLAAPNVIRISSPVRVTALGQAVTVNATIAMAVSVRNGRVVLTTSELDAGGVQVPQSALTARFEQLRALGESQINLQLQRALQGTALKLVNVVVTPNDMTAQFKYTP